MCEQIAAFLHRPLTFDDGLILFLSGVVGLLALALRSARQARGQ